MRSSLGVLRADPREAATSGLWHFTQGRAWVYGLALKMSLEGRFDPEPLGKALEAVFAETEKLRALQAEDA